MRVQDFVQPLVVVRLDKGAAGVVYDRAVAAPADIVQQPADERGLADADGAVDQKVHDLGVLHHVQAANLQIGLLAGLFQQPVHLLRLIGERHTRDKLVLALLSANAPHVPVDHAQQNGEGRAAGGGTDPQALQDDGPLLLHPRVSQQLRQRQFRRTQPGAGATMPGHVPGRRPGRIHQRHKTAEQAGAPVPEAVAQRILRRDQPERGARNQKVEKQYPAADPAVDLRKHAQAVGRHLAAPGEVFRGKTHGRLRKARRRSPPGEIGQAVAGRESG